MEFIRYFGELQCADCKRFESKPNIYYTWHGGKQVFWFVCLNGHSTEVAVGFEEIGPLSHELRTRNAKIRRFEEQNEVERYGTNWQDTRKSQRTIETLQERLEKLRQGH